MTIPRVDSCKDQSRTLVEVAEDSPRPDTYPSYGPTACTAEISTPRGKRENHGQGPKARRGRGGTVLLVLDLRTAVSVGEEGRKESGLRGEEKDMGMHVEG